MSERGQKFRRKGSALLAQVVATGRVLLVDRLGIDEETATEIARDYAHEIAKAFGGQLFYFPKDLALTLSRRDQQIYSEFTGNNHDVLARRYDLTTARIYQILDRVRREEMARRQGKLFAVDDAL